MSWPDYPSLTMSVWRSLDRARLSTLLDLDSVLAVANRYYKNRSPEEITAMRSWQIRSEIQKEIVQHNTKLKELRAELLTAFQEEYKHGH